MQVLLQYMARFCVAYLRVALRRVVLAWRGYMGWRVLWIST